MRPVGIRDVAALAGVSISTVSSALNSPDRVSRHSARIVAEAARALGYVPNSAARALRTGRGRTIALAFHDLGDPLSARVAHGALGAAAEAGHAALAADGAGDARLWGHALDLQLHHGVDGLVVDPGRDPPPALERLVAHCSAVVAVGADGLRGASSRIGVDHGTDARRAVSLLLSRGGRRILLVTDAETALVRAEILDGCAAAAVALGARLRILRLDDRSTTGGRRAGALLGAGPRSELPDGVLCTDPLLAVGLLRGLVGAGVAVPRDTAVLALGDDPLAEGGPVPLTVLRAPGRRLGTLAVAAVLDHLDGRAVPLEVREPSELVERASAPLVAAGGKLLHK